MHLEELSRLVDRYARWRWVRLDLQVAGLFLALWLLADLLIHLVTL